MTTKDFFEQSLYFSVDEFDSPDLLGSGVNMDLGFMIRLEEARIIADVPFVPSSGFRTKARNTKVGGVPNSSHLRGLAVDLITINPKTRFQVLTALLAVGFNRIGIGNSFIHVDDDPTKPGDVVWVY